MGTVCAPPYATIFMNKIDELMKELARNITNSDPIRLYKRFLDDIFLVWKGSVPELQTFLEEINNLHPSIKFTAELTCPYKCNIVGPHDCFCHQTQSIPFLDTSVSIKDGKFFTDLYRKPSDRCQYLLPSSCHPSHVTQNIPYNLCYRLLRICSNKETLEKRLAELKEFLETRSYRPRCIDDAINRVLNIPREEALKKVERKENERPVFVITYNPALPSLTQILKKHWKVMIKDPYLKEVFPEPPMVAYRRAKNLRDKLVKAKLPPPPTRKKRQLPGMKKCNKSGCEVCPFVRKGVELKIPISQKTVKLNASVDCTSKNTVYCIFCNKSGCNQIYVGQSQRELKLRFSEHKTSVRTNSKKNGWTAF